MVGVSADLFLVLDIFYLLNHGLAQIKINGFTE